MADKLQGVRQAWSQVSRTEENIRVAGWTG